jgi:hypothetical protein
MILQDSLTREERRAQFIHAVCVTETVWSLQCNEGFATSGSNEFEDENGDPLVLLCFWSEKALAGSNIQGEWLGYRPVEIPLGDFIENWCIGLANDNYMAGLDFDGNMHGAEVDPLELIVALSKELKRQSKEIAVENYNCLDDLVSEVERILSDE